MHHEGLAYSLNCTKYDTMKHCSEPDSQNPLQNSLQGKCRVSTAAGPHSTPGWQHLLSQWLQKLLTLLRRLVILGPLPMMSCVAHVMHLTGQSDISVPLPKGRPFIGALARELATLPPIVPHPGQRIDE